MNNNSRIVLRICVIPNQDQRANNLAYNTFLIMNNILNSSQKFPNLASFCRYCNTIGIDLGGYIRNQCNNLIEDQAFFNIAHSPQKMFNGINESMRKNIRVLLYPGCRDSICKLNMRETTHNMIIQFVTANQHFFASEPHEIPPSFYQPCSSVEMAINFFEALVFDSCLCRYLGISDVACYHNEKQRLSRDKISFLRELVQKKRLDFLSKEAQRLVKDVVSKLDINTPYVSFFSIFTVDILDVPNINNVESFFEDYLKLFGEFQKWYFEKQGHLFYKGQTVINAKDTVFKKSKYYGQISSRKFNQKLNELINNKQKYAEIQSGSPWFGAGSRWDVIIIKHTPSGSEEAKRFEALFSRTLRQSRWDIVPWTEREKYRRIKYKLENIPIMIVNS